MKPWMIYGANGYTGRLIAQEAKRRGLRPILAGRNPSVKLLADELGFESRLFSLDESIGEIARDLAGVSAVLHCAGPFSATSRPMLEGCMAARAHYLDITGEIDVFESIFARDAQLKTAGIAALPGAGFDVVPTDCLAAMLKRLLPDATHLAMAAQMNGRPSRGTTLSMIEGAAQGGRLRKDGKITSVPFAAQTREIVFDTKPVHAILTPWGDVSTAYHSTGIPNIEFYFTNRRGAEHTLRLAARLMRLRPVRSVARRLVSRFVSGPGEQELATGVCLLWGEVTNAAGARKRLRIDVPHGYQFTVDSALVCVEKIAAGVVAPGAWTPSNAFGADFVLGLRGVVRQPS